MKRQIFYTICTFIIISKLHVVIAFMIHRKYMYYMSYVRPFYTYQIIFIILYVFLLKNCRNETPSRIPVIRRNIISNIFLYMLKMQFCWYFLLPTIWSKYRAVFHSPLTKGTLIFLPFHVWIHETKFLFCDNAILHFLSPVNYLMHPFKQSYYLQQITWSLKVMCQTLKRFQPKHR